MESAAEYLPEARWQRCMVHFYRNVFSHVPATKVREVSHMLKAIHAQESREAADRKARAIVDGLRTAKMNTAADLVERSVSETLTYYAFPDIHWQKIRTNNPLERIMKEIRRRTRVVGAFPDGQSCLNLCRRTVALHRGHSMVRQVLYEYATALSAADRANRSRRLIKCAKDSGHYLRVLCYCEDCQAFARSTQPPARTSSSLPLQRQIDPGMYNLS